MLWKQLQCARLFFFFFFFFLFLLLFQWICLTLAVASSSVTPALWMSSFITSMNLHCGLPLFLLPGSSNSQQKSQHPKLLKSVQYYWKSHTAAILHIIHIIFMLVKPFSDASCTMDGTGRVHTDQNVLGIRNSFVLIFCDPSMWEGMFTHNTPAKHP